MQKRIKSDAEKIKTKLQPYDFMFYTNIYMTLTALVISAGS